MKKILLLIATATAILSCSKEQRNENKIAGRWYVAKKIIEGVDLSFTVDTVFYTFEPSKLAYTATMHGKIESADTLMAKFDYQLVKNTIVFNANYPKDKYNLSVSKTFITMNGENGNLIVLRKPN